MKGSTKVTGVILAGGQARRMNHADKGLVHYKGRPLAWYAVEAMSGIADRTIINANRNLDRYRQFGVPVVADQTASFDGPLSGILAAMYHADSDVLLVMPCDTPLIKTEHLRKLLTALEANRADAAVAFDGERVHPVFLAVRTSVIGGLQDYLASGQRKVNRWLELLHTVRADFGMTPNIFRNINTLAELAELENKADETTL